MEEITSRTKEYLKKVTIQKMQKDKEVLEYEISKIEDIEVFKKMFKILDTNFNKIIIIIDCDNIERAKQIICTVLQFKDLIELNISSKKEENKQFFSRKNMVRFSKLVFKGAKVPKLNLENLDIDDNSLNQFERISELNLSNCQYTSNDNLNHLKLKNLSMMSIAKTTQLNIDCSKLETCSFIGGGVLTGLELQNIKKCENAYIKRMILEKFNPNDLNNLIVFDCYDINYNDNKLISNTIDLSLIKNIEELKNKLSQKNISTIKTDFENVQNVNLRRTLIEYLFQHGQKYKYVYNEVPHVSVYKEFAHSEKFLYNIIDRCKKIDLDTLGKSRYFMLNLQNNFKYVEDVYFFYVQKNTFKTDEEKFENFESNRSRELKTRNIYTGIQNRYTICANDAQILQFLCRNVGVECQQLHTDRHVFNAIELEDGKKVILDTTFGRTDAANGIKIRSYHYDKLDEIKGIKNKSKYVDLQIEKIIEIDKKIANYEKLNKSYKSNLIA